MPKKKGTTQAAAGAAPDEDTEETAAEATPDEETEEAPAPGLKKCAACGVHCTIGEAVCPNCGTTFPVR